jgi:penicillin-binding protein 1A
MGYTSGFLAGVWVGADNPAIHFRGMRQGRGAATAMPIWAGFYKKVSKDTELQYLVSKPFSFPNDLDCEMYKDDTFLQKLFQRKSRTDHKTGLEETDSGRIKKRRERKVRKK